MLIFIVITSVVLTLFAFSLILFVVKYNERKVSYEKEKANLMSNHFSELQERERIVREQNLLLEAKVAERTSELKIVNDELSRTLANLKNAQTQLVQSEKMASFGELTAGIVHEIGNPLTSINPAIQVIKRNLETIFGNEELRKEEEITEINEMISIVEVGFANINSVVKSIRTFSRSTPSINHSYINEIITNVLTIFKLDFNKKITVVKELAMGIPSIQCDPAKINQVLINILKNAIEAIGQKENGRDDGVVKVSTSKTLEHVIICIEDNGIGIMDIGNLRTKIFEPFYTTKEEGTGLGLSIVYNIIKDHNGSIEVESCLGEGTTFTIKLPFVQS